MEIFLLTLLALFIYDFAVVTYNWAIAKHSRMGRAKLAFSGVFGSAMIIGTVLLLPFGFPAAWLFTYGVLALIGAATTAPGEVLVWDAVNGVTGMSLLTASIIAVLALL